MEDVMERLKPCPFCGQVPELKTFTGESCTFYYIRCANPECPATCASVQDKESSKAAARWNKRHSSRAK